MPSKTDLRNKEVQPKIKLDTKLNKQTEDVERIGEQIQSPAPQDTQTTTKQDSGWAWIVLICSFWCIFILDGIVFTYGALFTDIVHELKVSDSLVALVNSLQLSLYFILSPLGSSFINSFGFRACTMIGSIITSFGLLLSYFSSSYGFLLTFYGILAGLGCALINMGAGLIVGFYFNKYRSLALAITTVGSSAGITAFFPVNTSLVRIAGWRPTTLLHSGLFGMIYFLAMSFKPTREREVEVPSTSTEQKSLKLEDNSDPKSHTQSKTEPFTQPVSSTSAGPATEGRSSISTATLKSSQGNFQKQSTSVSSAVKSKIILNIEYKKTPKKRNFWSRLCNWGKSSKAHSIHKHDKSARPVKFKSLKAHRNRDSVEYRIEVTRDESVNIPQRKPNVCIEVVKKVFARMVDTALIQKYSFQLLCSSNFFAHLGMLVPFIYLQHRNEVAGVDPKHCSFFISVASISNAIGKLTLNVLTIKIACLKVYSVSIIIAGTSTIVSSLSYSLAYQYAYSIVFGFFVSVLSAMKSVVLVYLYGLDKLTNSTGMMLIFIGLGCLFSTPVAGLFKDAFGYDVAFYFSGVCMALGGMIVIPIQAIAKRENNF